MKTPSCSYVPMDKCFEVFKATMVKAFQSSFPPFPNLVKIKVDLDKLNNTDLLPLSSVNMLGC